MLIHKYMRIYLYVLIHYCMFLCIHTHVYLFIYIYKFQIHLIFIYYLLTEGGAGCYTDCIKYNYVVRTYVYSLQFLIMDKYVRICIFAHI